MASSARIGEPQNATPPENQSEGWATRLIQRLLGIDRDRLLKKLVPWVSKGGLAILDQGLISGSNFLTSVLLARWMMPEQYGAYAIAFGVYVLLQVVYQSQVLEPMTVFAGSAYRKCLRGYLGSVLWVHTTVSLGILTVFGVGALGAMRLSHNAGLAGALAGVTFATPWILGAAMARRSFYLQLAPAQAALGAFIYSTTSVAGLYVLRHYALLSPFTAFTLMGVSALATGVFQFMRLRRDLPKSDLKAPGPRETWKRHWKYGRWALASSVAGWIPAYIYYPLLSSFGNIAHSGQLKALMNLTLPMEQTKAALGLLLLPYAARVHGEEGHASAKKLSVRMTMISTGGALIYWLVILPFQRPVFHLLYSNRYMDVVHLLPVIAFGSIVWSAAYGPAIALRSMESPKSVFTAFSLATATSLLVGVPATWKFGLQGAIWGGNLADMLSLTFVVIVLRKKIASGNQVVAWNARSGRLAKELPAE